MAAVINVPAAGHKSHTSYEFRVNRVTDERTMADHSTGESKVANEQSAFNESAAHGDKTNQTRINGHTLGTPSVHWQVSAGKCCRQMLHMYIIV